MYLLTDSKRDVLNNTDDMRVAARNVQGRVSFNAPILYIRLTAYCILPINISREKTENYKKSYHSRFIDTSAPIVAWKCSFCEIMTDHQTDRPTSQPTNQPTDQPTDGRTDGLIGKFHFQ